jgi:deoxyribodipyrimidine photo-lyase
MKQTINIIWFRRDLRLADNAALYYALKESKNVLPIFIFDKNILDDLGDKTDKRVEFIYNALQEIQTQLVELGSTLEVFYTTPINALSQLLEKYTIENVYTNHDYEQYALQRDNEITKLLKLHNASLKTFKDQTIFEKDEVTKDDGKPYTVFTPYSKKWKLKLNEFYYKSYPTEKYFNNFYKQNAKPIITLDEMGFTATETIFPKKSLSIELVKKYTDQRNFPSINGTSRLGVHLRFGTISIRKLVQYILPLNETFLNELIWRDFYFTILHHFPHISTGNAFRQEYDLIS